MPPELKSFIQSCVAAPLTNTQRKKQLEAFAMPDIQELRPPKLDTTLKLLVPKATSAHDGWLQKMQALAIDSYSPILSLLNRPERDTPQEEEVKTALRSSLKLLGNLFARLSQERRRKVLCAIHKDLGHMADEEFKSPSFLFGDEVVDRIKSRHEALKTLRAAKQPFRKGGTQKQGQSGRQDFQGHSRRGKFPFKRGGSSYGLQKGGAQNKK